MFFLLISFSFLSGYIFDDEIIASLLCGEKVLDKEIIIVISRCNLIRLTNR